MKQIVIVKESKTKVKFHKDYLEISSIYENRVIAKRFIKEFYMNQQIVVKPSELINLAKKVKVYFINQHGTILSSLRLENEKV